MPRGFMPISEETVVCSEYGALQSKETVFCTNCGSRMEKIKRKARTQQIVRTAENSSRMESSSVLVVEDG